MSTLAFRTVRFTDPEIEPLLEGMRWEYESRYGPVDVMQDTEPAEFEPPDGAFLVLLDGSVTVSGGGIRRLDSYTCEVKRMWTAPGYRRQGYGRIVLAALEELALERGYRRIRLETGLSQPEAVALYRAMGYKPIPIYGRYSAAVAFEKLFSGDSGER